MLSTTVSNFLLRLSVGRLALSLLCSSGAASAQTAPPDSFSLRVGAGVANGPLYPGSSERTVRLLPTLDARFGRWFAGAVPAAPNVAGAQLGIGVDLVRSQGLRLGAALTTDLSDIRREKDAARLSGLGDIEGTQRANLFGVWSVEPLVLRANLATDVGGRELGTLATIEADAVLRPAPGWTLAVGPSVTLANRKFTQTVFGLGAVQSARSGLPAFDTQGGALAVRLGATLGVTLDDRWSAGARVAALRLLGDAADSPITQRRWQPLTAAFATYRY